MPAILDKYNSEIEASPYLSDEAKNELISKSNAIGTKLKDQNTSNEERKSLLEESNNLFKTTNFYKKSLLKVINIIGRNNILNADDFLFRYKNNYI